MAADIASTLAGWSATEGSNAPAGTTSISTNIDDNLRMLQKVIREGLASIKTGNLTSASTTDIGAEEEFVINIDGSTTITSLGTVSAGIHKVLVFTSVLTLTHNATSLILPRGGSNIATAAGDIAWFLSLGSGNWRCLAYMRASGSALTETAAGVISDGIVGSPGLRWSSDTNNGLYRIGSDNWAASVGSTKAWELTTTQFLTFLPQLIENPSSTTLPAYEVRYTDATDREAGFKFSNSGNGGPFNSGSAAGAFYSRLKSLVATDLHAHFLAEHLDAGQTQQNFISFYSNVTSSADLEFEVTTLGAVSSDGGSSMTTPADYAEMFEWADGNPTGEDRVGMSVALVGDRIRIATGADEPIGVVSAMPAVLADSGELRWNGKYLRDQFGRFVLNEHGERVLNPAFDPEAPYTPRTQRKEWAPIGLVGKLRVRKGQQIGDRWILMRNINADVDEYLVR